MTSARFTPLALHDLKEIRDFIAAGRWVPVKDKDCAPLPEPADTAHPDYYGGKDNPYEAIKVIEAWGLGFNLGNVVKYIARAGKKGAALPDLIKARDYITFEIESLERKGGK